MADKFGPYITKLMTTVLDSEQEEFVIELAFGELRRLNVNLEEFLRKNASSDDEEVEKTVEKMLLNENQEDK
jgi:hypothetical protein